MLFPIKDLRFVVPPVLHVLLGITLYLYNLLLGYCQQLDKEEKGYGEEHGDMEVSNEWLEVSLLLSERNEKLHKIGKEIVEIENRIGRIEAVVKGGNDHNTSIAKRANKASGKQRSQEMCSSLICCVTHFDDSITVVQCDNCNSWVHTLCECFHPFEDLTITTVEWYMLCLHCRDIEKGDLAGMLKSKIDDTLGEEDRLQLEINELSKPCYELKARAACKMGSREKLPNRKLEDMKVIRQAYHGNVFVGNHCKLILNTYESLCNVVADKPDFHHKLNTVFGIFSKICPLLFLKSRHLTSDEIASIKQLCNEFGEVFPVFLPECNVPRRLHEVILNVPRFVSEFRMTGITSEEEGRSIHASVNSELCQLFSVREPARKLPLTLKRQELRSKAPKSLLAHAPRLCTFCKDKRQLSSNEVVTKPSSAKCLIKMGRNYHYFHL